MGTRASYAGTAQPGDVYTASNHAEMPGGWIVYDAETSSETTSSTTELTLHSATATVKAGRRYKMTFYCGFVAVTVANDTFFIRMKYNGTTISRFNVTRTSTADDNGIMCAMVVDNTSGTSGTFAVTAQRNAGTGTLTIGRSATGIGYMLVEDIGPAE
jgi:hypothetical protein